MRYFASFLVAFFFTNIFFAQQIELKGEITIHNSKYNTGQVQYVKDAYISAPFTKPANTDDSGSFALEFVGLDPGTSIALQVEKSGLEVVNQYDLKDVVIARNLPVRVYLADKGKLAEAQTELYNISKDALFKRKDALIARLRQSDANSKATLKELEAFLGHPIEDRVVAENELIEKINDLEKRLPEFAQNLAKQNLDFASDMYIKAYEFYKQGEIEKAIGILDSTALENSYKEAQDNIAKGKALENQGQDLQQTGLRQIEQLIESYDLKAKSYSLIFNYGESVAMQLKIIEILEQNSLDNSDLARRYFAAAVALFENGKYNNAIAYLDKFIVLAEKTPAIQPIEYARAYSYYAVTYERQSNYESSMEYLLKEVKLKEEVLDSLHPELAIAYNNIGLTYSRLNDSEKALLYANKGLEIRKKIFPENHVDISTSYNDLGLIYEAIYEYDKAVEFQEKAVAIREAILEPTHPFLALSYDNLATAYYYYGNYQNAMDYALKALEIRKEILDPNHPDLAITYDTLAKIAYSLGDYESELAYYQMRLQIREQIYGKSSPYVSGANYNVASALDMLNRHDEALEYTLHSIKLLEGHVDENSPAYPSRYGQLSMTYYKKGDYAAAIEYANKARDIYIFHEGDMSKYLGVPYNNTAFIYLAMNDFDKALEYQEKALKINLSFRAADHYLVGQMKMNLSYIQYKLKEYNKAWASITSGNTILTNKFGDVHPLTIKSYVYMGLIQSGLENNELAKQYQVKATKLLAELPESNQRDVPEKLEELDKKLNE